MTLVVGRIEGPRLAIVSDTLLIEHNQPLPFQSGVIKSCMLPGNICVSFANSPITAERTFREFVDRHPAGASFADVVSFFKRSSADTGNDYLVAFANPAKLLKIVDGRHVRSLSKTNWIGDQAAFERFREFESKQRRRYEHGRAINIAYFADEVDKSPASDIFSTIINVINDHTIPSVGGFASVISNRGFGFRFSVYCNMLFDWPSAKGDKYNFSYTDKISLQVSGENTDSSIAQISPGFCGMNFVGYYFLMAKKLFFFYGQNFGLANQCRIFNNIHATQIPDVLNNFLGIDLNWLLTITSPRQAPYREKVPGIKEPGSQLAFFVEANTFPKV